MARSKFKKVSTRGNGYNRFLTEDDDHSWEFRGQLVDVRVARAGIGEPYVHHGIGALDAVRGLRRAARDDKCGLAVDRHGQLASACRLGLHHAHERHDIEARRHDTLEDGFVCITRVSGTVRFPASFMLAAAMNPCPCGYLGHPRKKCVCPSRVVENYRSRISGPLLDRIDMHVEMPFVDYDELTSETAPESSEKIRARCLRARMIQWERYKKTPWHSNSQISSAAARRFCPMTEGAEKLLRAAVTKLALSARTYTRILRVARTIADLEGREKLEEKHLLEALQFKGFREI